MMTNSSPASRAAVSGLSTSESSRRADLRQDLIAGDVAIGVVDVLEAVEVDVQHRDRRRDGDPGPSTTVRNRSSSRWRLGSPVNGSCRHRCSSSCSISLPAGDVFDVDDQVLRLVAERDFGALSRTHTSPPSARRSRTRLADAPPSSGHWRPAHRAVVRVQQPGERHSEELVRRGSRRARRRSG